jgi:hypothetical protein
VANRALALTVNSAPALESISHTAAFMPDLLRHTRVPRSTKARLTQISLRRGLHSRTLLVVALAQLSYRKSDGALSLPRLAPRVLIFLMPNPKKKKACHCTHGRAIHHTKKVGGKIKSPCNFPNCPCKDYDPKG